jgi:hypothetical protein
VQVGAGIWRKLAVNGSEGGVTGSDGTGVEVGDGSVSGAVWVGAEGMESAVSAGEGVAEVHRLQAVTIKERMKIKIFRISTSKGGPVNLR